MGRALVVDSRRLFAAADELLRAMNSPEGVDRVFPGRHVHGARPRHARGYSRTELVEAMSMLIRMGYTTPAREARAR